MLRPAYPDLLNMPWIMHNRTVQVDMKEWVLAAVARRDSVAADKM